jgi:DNA-binding MarR family transcriptional regulator
MVSHRRSRVSSDVLASVDAFRRIVQTLRTSGREVERRAGLSSAQLFALQQLSLAPGVSVNELAARTFTHQSSVSVVVSRLVEQGLVARISSRDDRRRVSLALTPAGRRAIGRSPEPMQQQLTAGIAALSGARRHAFAEALAEIARAMAGADSSDLRAKKAQKRPARTPKRH